MPVPPSSARRKRKAKRRPRLRYGLTFLLLSGLAWLLLMNLDFDEPLISTEGDPALEISALADAVEAYRVKYGEYPPGATSDKESLRKHLLRLFPGLAPDESIPPKLDAAEALVFWLSGFSSNPEYPITGQGGPLDVETPRRAGFYAFDSDRLVITSNGNQIYLPSGLGRTEPYVYFLTARPVVESYPVDNPRMEAYRKDADTFVNPSSFQILSAGEDDQWGDLPPPFYPAGPFLGGHADNRTNFAAGPLGE